MAFEPVLIFSAESDKHLKCALAAHFSSVKPTLRLEALARAIGYKSRAAMLADGGVLVRDVDARTFIAFLADRNHLAAPIMVYRAVADFALQSVLAVHPRLTPHGVGLYEQHSSRSEWRALNGDQREKAFAATRADFRHEVELDGFLHAMAFLTTVQRIASQNQRHSSYDLKHSAEKFEARYPDGSNVGNGYVSNGGFIAAGWYLGFAVGEYPDSPNATFNIAERSLRKVQQERV